MNAGFSGDPSHSEQLESALHFIRALQQQIISPGSNPSPAICSPTDSDYSRGSYRESSSPERHTVIKDAMMATTTIKLQPSMSIISGGGNLSRRSSSPLPPSRDGTMMYSPRCSICPYEWDGQPPIGVGEARIYRLNPSPRASNLKAGTQQLVRIEAKEIK